MRALVTGAAGFIGGALAARLERAPGIEEVVRLDRALAPGILGCDLAEPEALAALPLEAPDLVFHVAGVTAAACEADPDAGFRANVEGTRALLAWCRALPRPPRIVFTSTVAVFGGGEAAVDENSPARPRSTYGALKLMAEFLVLDASRRGEVEGAVIRLPVVAIRPDRLGRPGAGFLSDLIRHAVAGRPFVAPLPPERAVPLAGIERTLDRLLALATGPAPARAIQHVPSIAATAADAIAALEARGIRPAGLSFRPDPAVAHLIAGWPERLASLDEALPAPASLAELIDEHLARRPAALAMR